METNKINVLYEFHNPYLNRSEYLVEFDINKGKMPTRNELRDFFAKRFNCPPELIVIKSMKSTYGGLKAYADIRIYNDKESMNVEPQYVLLRHLSREERNKIIEEMKKKKLEAKKSKEVSKK
ncbi:MAG TPA: hypothetical protein VKU94_03140 [Geobacterales bacterium]|nr:hypothetical protein [Geobacterales bacterium]